MAENTLAAPLLSECGLDIRRAVEPDDGFLLALFVSVREKELALTPWTEEQRAMFIEHQFGAQRMHYRREYPNAGQFVLSLKGAAAGMLYIDFSGADVEILDLIIATESRNQGLGACVLKVLQSEARRMGKDLTVYVDRTDRSFEFFGRLGFR